MIIGVHVMVSMPCCAVQVWLIIWYSIFYILTQILVMQSCCMLPQCWDVMCCAWVLSALLELSNHWLLANLIFVSLCVCKMKLCICLCICILNFYFGHALHVLLVGFDREDIPQRWHRNVVGTNPNRILGMSDLNRAFKKVLKN